MSTIITIFRQFLISAIFFSSIAIGAEFDEVEKRNNAGKEFVILSGGPALRKWEDLRRPQDQHDRWWGNFIRTARIRIEQLRRAHGESAEITWLVYKRGYTVRGREEGRSLIELIHSVRDKYGVRLVWFDTGDEVIRYINSGKNRRRTKIASFDFFGHSNKFCFLFDYSAEIIGASRSFLHQRDLRKIKRGAFDRHARCTSYGCHTGESMSRLWRSATGVRMRGANGKTDYSRSYEGTLPFISPGGFWTE